MKKIYRIFLLVLLLFVSFFIYKGIEEQNDKKERKKESVFASEEPQEISYDDVKMVIPSGEAIGIYVKTKGVMVIDITEIKDENGDKESPCKGLFMPGDYIISVNGEEIEDKDELISIIENSNGNPLYMGVIRNGDEIEIKVNPKKSQGKYMLGLWIKDDISGIGTLTYVDEDGFTALGHSINDNDTGTIMSISDGAIYKTTLVNIVKSDGERPGRLEGVIDYSKENVMGRVVVNYEYGIKGYMTKNGVDNYTYGEWMRVAKKEEARMGEAYILSCISGKPVYYEIEITNVDISSSAGNKGLEIKVTDERLLELTNGIVQGMSGTPIIQQGKLLGAITHVFVKDSTKGYGTFVEDMMQ